MTGLDGKNDPESSQCRLGGGGHRNGDMRPSPSSAGWSQSSCTWPHSCSWPCWHCPTGYRLAAASEESVAGLPKDWSRWQLMKIDLIWCNTFNVCTLNIFFIPVIEKKKIRHYRDTLVLWYKSSRTYYLHTGIMLKCLLLISTYGMIIQVFLY